jgi:integrase
VVDKVKLGKRVIEGFALPASGRQYIFDTDVPALALCLTAAGSKTFYVYRRVQGKPQRIRLGGYPELTVEQARKRAAEVNLQIVDGQNPQQAKRRLREEPTVQEIFDLWMRHAKANKRTWEQDEYQYRRFLSQWGPRKLRSIRRLDVAQLQSQIGENHGRYAANRVLALLRAMINHGIRLLELDLTNPAAAVSAFKEETRERRLHPEELPAFFTALDEEQNEDIRDYIFLSLFTGARKSNVLSMAWAEIKLEQRLWTIPASKSKNGQALYQPLSAEALQILQERRSRQGREEVWVFPGPGVTGHLQDPKFGWMRICKRAGLADLRLHDLRRSLASFQVDLGASLEVVGKTLGHHSAETTRIYARLALDPVRRSVEEAGKAIALLGRGTQLAESEEEPDNELE